MKCPRKNCKNEATYNKIFGVLPCQAHQKSDAQYSIRGFTEQHHPRKYDRIQRQRDKFLKDLQQPYQSNKANIDFFKANPDRVDDYGVRSELEKA